VLVTVQVYPDSLAKPGLLVNPRNKYDAQVSCVVKLTTKQNLGNLVANHTNFDDLKATKSDEVGKLNLTVPVLKSFLAGMCTIVHSHTLLRGTEALWKGNLKVVQTLSHLFFPPSLLGVSPPALTTLLADAVPVNPLHVTLETQLVTLVVLLLLLIVSISSNREEADKQNHNKSRKQNTENEELEEVIHCLQPYC
jgi:hypothetical protein